MVGALADYYDLLVQAALPYPPAEGPLAFTPAVLVGCIERGPAPREDLIEQREAPLLFAFLLGTDHHGTLHDPGYGFSTPGTLPYFKRQPPLQGT